MTIIERMLRHDAWTTRTLLRLSADLPDRDLDREFDIGHRTLRRTFAHIVDNMECWYDLMAGRPQRWSHHTPKPPPTIADFTARLDTVAAELLALGARVAAEHREDEMFTDYLESPPRCKPLGAGLVHVATHGSHHRAQCLYLLRRLGLRDLPEGDALHWERTHLKLKRWPESNTTHA